MGVRHEFFLCLIVALQNSNFSSGSFTSSGTFDNKRVLSFYFVCSGNAARNPGHPGFDDLH